MIIMVAQMLEFAIVPIAVKLLIIKFKAELAQKNLTQNKETSFAWTVAKN